jgi:predicted LPLAT superfamily acyltransferase
MMSWATVQEAGFAKGMWFLYYVYRIFGRWPLRICLYPVVFWYFISRKRARQSSIAYLAHVGVKATLGHSFKHFMAFAECLVDKLLVWSGCLDLSTVKVTGRSHVLALLERGQGGIILTAHLGNLELCRALSLQQKRMRINVLVHTSHNPRFNQLLKALDKSSDATIIQISTITPATAILLNQKIAAGEFIVMAADRVPATNPAGTMKIPFLGQQASFPMGPMLMASLFSCPVLLVFSFKSKNGYQMYIEPFAQRITLPRHAKAEALTAYLTQYAQRLAIYCYKAPLQWFNFYPFWEAHDKHEYQSK